MTANEDIFDGAVRHLHWLERYKSGEVRRIVTLLNIADKDLVERIAVRLTRIGRGENPSKAETERLEKLLKEIRDTKEGLSYALYEEARVELTEFALHEVEFKQTLIEAAGVSLTKPSISQLKAVVTARPFQGRFLKDWYKGLGENQAQRITDALRIGIIEGQTTDQIVRRIRGSKALKYTDGIMEMGRRETATIVRTAIAHVANKASEELYAENHDFIEGVQWVSTLDGRTTALCASRDGKIYPVGKGPRPPAHHNCRSTTIPYLGVSSGSRASAFGPVPRSETYQTWLRKQSAAFQDEALGKGKAKLFREEKYSLDRFIDPTGREYTLQQLKQLDL